MRPRQHSDEEILKTAREIFIKNGPKTAVEKIANKLGISQPALFKRFKTKKNLLLNALKPPAIIPWFRHIEQGPDDRPFVEQLTELAVEIRSFFAKMFPVIMVANQSGIVPMKFFKNMKEPPPVKAIRLMKEWLQRCHKKGLIRKIDFEITATSILGLLQMDTMLTMMIPDRPHADKEQIKKSVDLIWNGLNPEEK